MNVKRLFALIMVTLIIMTSLTACGKKEDMAIITFEPCVMEIGQTKTVPVVLPDETTTVKLDDNIPVGLSASFAEGTVTINGVAVGEYSLNLIFSAKGYNDGVFPVAVSVKEPPPPVLPVAIFSELLGLNSSIPPKSPINLKLEQGLSAELSTMAKVEGFTVTATSSDPCLVATVTGNTIGLDPVTAGNATLTVTVSHPQYSDAVVECRVEVKPPHTKLELADGTNTPITVSKGQSTTIPVAYDGALSFAIVPDSGEATTGTAPEKGSTAEATAVAENGKVTVTGVAEGSAKLVITSTQAGFQDSELELNINVTAPPAPPAAKLPAVPTSKYAELEAEMLKYINIERAAMGAPALKMNGTMSKAAQLRAQETAENESHTRPDGTRGLTVFNDFKLTKFNLMGENLAGSDSAESGDEVVARWMDSPSHRSALLDARFSETGVGAYLGSDGVYRYCQLFGGVVTQ